MKLRVKEKQENKLNTKKIKIGHPFFAITGIPHYETLRLLELSQVEQIPPALWAAGGLETPLSKIHPIPSFPASLGRGSPAM